MKKYLQDWSEIFKFNFKKLPEETNEQHQKKRKHSFLSTINIYDNLTYITFRLWRNCHGYVSVILVIITMTRRTQRSLIQAITSK